MIFEAECGLLFEEDSSSLCVDNSGSTYINGVEYSSEIGRTLCHCPYGERCKESNLVEENPIMLDWFDCIVTKTDKQYDYETSGDKINIDLLIRSNQKRAEMEIEATGHEVGCMSLDKDGKGGVINNYPHECWGRHPYGCDADICAITGKLRNLEIVSLYGDKKYTVDHGRFTEHEKLMKGIKIAGPYHYELLERSLKAVKQSGEYYRVYIKKNSSKDLLQDLQDAREGLEVAHESDMQKAKKEAKSERRKLAKEKNLEKRLKQWIKTGDLQHKKYLIARGMSEKELDEVRRIPVKKPSEKCEQVSMFERGQIS